MNIFLPLLSAALAGGVLSLLAQLLIDLLSLPPARVLVLYVTAGVGLYACGIYPYLFDIFGAGVSLPILGFGATVAKGVKEAIDAKGFIGILSGGLESVAMGITLALTLGLLFSLFFRSSAKRM